MCARQVWETRKCANIRAIGCATAGKNEKNGGKAELSKVSLLKGNLMQATKKPVVPHSFLSVVAPVKPSIAMRPFQFSALCRGIGGERGKAAHTTSSKLVAQQQTLSAWWGATTTMLSALHKSDALNAAPVLLGCLL